MGRRRNNLNGIAALAAALVLVLQSVFGAAALGADTAPRDIFGNVICVAGMSGSSQGHQPEGGHLPDCCMLGCSISAQLLANAPEDTKDLLFSPKFVAVAAPPLPATPALDDSGQQPGNPRAPPFPA